LHVKLARVVGELGRSRSAPIRTIISRMRPAAASPAQPGAPVTWEGAHDALERLLRDCVLAFWDERVIDRHGGYRLAFDVRGRRRREGPRRIVTQARTAWFFARVSKTPYGSERHLDWALHGLAFMRNRMWDREQGGFYWEVDRRGPTDDRKHLYGQAFGLIALGELADDPAARELCGELLELIERRAHDDRHGGYLESLRRDWSPELPGSSGLIDAPADCKTMNTHLHLLTALMPPAARQRRERERLAELLEVLGVRVVRPEGSCSDAHRRDWTPQAGWRASYGHDLESVWLQMRACAVLGRAHPNPDLYAALCAHALEHGFDRERGGFYASGPPERPADRREKVWWVQAEALVALLEMYLRTQDEVYRNAFLATLDWVAQRQADWRRGDWHYSVGPGGAPSGYKAGPWKSALHQGRALIECMSLLAGADPEALALRRGLT
jgi:mannose/cellobiose epimerase-like protein (N-acyl-D-glucosamine 2-epimerase family)